MEVPNQDLKTISALVTDQRVEEIEQKNNRIIYAVPGESPLRPAKKSKRTKYNDVQLHEAVELAKIVGVPAAAEKMGVEESSIYKFASRTGNSISYLKSGLNAPVMPSRRYPPQKLKAAFERGLAWHKNTGVALRTCVTRAAAEVDINANYLWALYCNKSPILGLTHIP